MTFLAVAHNRITSGTARTLQVISDAGAQQWSADHGVDCYCVAVDEDLNVYVGGALASDGKNVRSYDVDGALRWSADTAYSTNNYIVNGITVGGGKVFTAQKNTAYIGDSSRTNVFRLVSSSGAQDWAANTSYHAYAVIVNSDGRCRVASDTYTDTQFNTSGVRDWRISSPGDIAYGMARVDDEYHVIAGTRDSTKTVWKLRSVSNASPSTVWSADHGATVWGVAVDPASGAVYTVGDRTSNLTTRAYNSAGTLLWSADHGAQVLCVAVGADGAVYTGGVASGGYEIRKYSSAGTLLGSLAIGATVRGLATFEGVAGGLEPDGISIGLALGLPRATLSIRSPALTLRLGVAVPAVSAYPAAPDVMGLGQQVMRGFLAFGDVVAELPLVSLQCRRRLGASTWLTVACPWSAALESVVEAGLGGILLVESGVRIGSIEQRGEFLRATLTEWSAERDVWASSLSLTGRVQTPTYVATQRALAGVSAKGIDGGRRGETLALAEFGHLARALPITATKLPGAADA
jgi:hypothetical protein